MIGVVIPVHNEELLLAACLRAVAQAAGHAMLNGEQVCPVVVLDACSDSSASIAAQAGVHCLTISERNVGAARRAGADWLLQQGARWLASTDADSLVPEDWLVRQIHSEAEVVCGTVRVTRWDEYPDAVRNLYLRLYQQREGHRHIHGANLGVCAHAYQRAGGFPPVMAHEDVALVHALEALGARISWTAGNSVETSARREARCAEGFSDYLKGLAATT